MLVEKIKDVIRKRAEDVLASKKKAIPLPSFDVSVPPPKVGGEVATNLCLVLAKTIGQSPQQLAEEMIREFPRTDWVKKVDVAGGGYLNFWFTDEAYRLELEDLLLDRKPAGLPLGQGNILIEFVSANPTGPLHVGHGRGAALGDSLVRIFRYLGEEVTAEFYINDAGGQIRNLGLSVEARLQELEGKKVEFPEDGYRGSYVVDLAKEALEAGKKFKPIQPSQMLFGGSDAAGFASARLLSLIQKDLNDFNVHFDSWFRESTLHEKKKIEDVFKFLEMQGHAYEQGGALWFRATEFGDDKDRVLKKANEAPTYFAADIAYHFDKYNRGYKRLVNIWGADHHGYAQRLKGVMKAIGHDPESLKIILNQLVSIKGGRVSKRAGDIVTLREVMDEVGRDAARFFFALRSPGSHFEFDLDLAKKQAPDNPVYYVQYVHARCCSIFKEAEKRGMEADLFGWKKAELNVPLEEAERAVLLQLMDFDRVVQMCARDGSSHHLTVYLLELAGKYHSFYERCRVLEEDPALRSFRLGLIEAIRRRVAKGLDLLGVSAPERL
ncbi:MAG: arginine--tRNA ligase [Elusimicrobia bacterium]|nr:arginine--tRNA ligase [Candidatus Obscuribacterium magneticum]